MSWAAVSRWCLLPHFRRSVGLGLVVFPTDDRPETPTNHYGAGPIDLVSGVELGQEHRMQPSRRCRQQDMPEPQLISWGSISKGMSDFNTKRIPINVGRFWIHSLSPHNLGGSEGNRIRFAVYPPHRLEGTRIGGRDRLLQAARTTHLQGWDGVRVLLWGSAGPL